jgi:hypothetical protein
VGFTVELPAQRHGVMNMKNKELRKQIKKAKSRVHKLHKQLKQPFPKRLFEPTSTIMDDMSYLDMTTVSNTEVNQVIAGLF